MKLTVKEIAIFADDAKKVTDYLEELQSHAKYSYPVGCAMAELAAFRIGKIANQLMDTEICISQLMNTEVRVS